MEVLAPFGEDLALEDEPEAQLGALTGENADGSLAWVGAQGEPLERVKRWAPMPAPGKPDALTLRLLAADKLYEEAEQLLRLTSLFRCDYQANADLARALQQYDQARSAA